jgi:hypothetical protein
MRKKKSCNGEIICRWEKWQKRFVRCLLTHCVSHVSREAVVRDQITSDCSTIHFLCMIPCMTIYHERRQLYTHTHTYTHTHKHMPLVFSHKKTNIILELRKYLLNKGLNLFRVCVLFYFVLRKLRQYKWNYNFCVLTISLHPFF